MMQSRPLAEFFGAAKPMSVADWRLAATRLRVEPAAIRAVAQQEAFGRSGFLSDKRPIILFEAHQFGKFTNHRFDAAYPTLSTVHWDRSLYLGGAAEYDRLAAAIRLDRTAALRATSWGMFQIMGFNHAVVGYGDVEKFVRAMCDSEGDQLQAFVTFVQKQSPLLRALQGHNWARFALLYNGEGYKQNNYDRNMALYYKRFRSDTVWLAGAAQRPPHGP